MPGPKRKRLDPIEPPPVVALMTSWRDGSINFEQLGVEFPDSVNAVNIVTSKYFRGAVGSPQREKSLKQLIDRVVLTYRRAGEEHGYFGSPADAKIFELQLTYARAMLST